MINLTQYTDQELSLQVFNDEGLYNMRHSTGFIDMLGEWFIYTPEQMAVLEQDLEADKDEQ